jgi:hypothetical protein
MNLKRMVCASTLAAGVGVAGLFGVGLSTAGADPGQPCGAPNAPACQRQPAAGPQNNGPAPQNNRPGPNDWQNHDINQGRQDHQPFRYNGQQVQPMPAGNGAGWGFWFLGQWIPL